MPTRTRVSARTNVGTVELYVTDCPDCGVIFAVLDDYDGRRRADTRGFYCPNGHVMSYRKSEADRLREQLASMERRLGWAQETANDNGARALLNARQAAAYKGHLTRIRRAIASGLCPCCRRHFDNVERHIKGQHPEFVAKANEAKTGGAS